MDWMKLLQEIFTICIIPLLGILTKYFISFLETKKEDLIKQQDTELKKTYIELLTNTIETCVIATNQTYVEALKNQNAFTPEAQKKAFEKTKEAVFAILSEEAQKYLTQVYGDLNKYITTQIEQQVNVCKTNAVVG